MSEHAQLAFLWDALCQKWLSEGQITGYSIGPELIFIEFGPNDWHEFR